MKSDQVCETGKYPPDPATSYVPTYEVNLDLPPDLRWLELSRKYEKPVGQIFFILNQILNNNYF